MNKIIILTLLLSSYLLSFDWAQKVYYFIFLAGAYGIAQLYISKRISRKNYWVIVGVFFATLFSNISGLMQGLSVNWSWTAQFVLIPFVVLAVNYLYSRNGEYIIIYGKNIYLLCLATQLMQIAINLYFYGGGHFLSYDTILFGDVYDFANTSTEKIGLLKGVIPWITFVFYLLTQDQFSNKKSLILFLIGTFFTVAVGAKATLIGIFFVLSFGLVCKLRNSKNRIFTFYICFILSIIFVIYFNQEINAITIFNGRYFGPIFGALDFWRNPFGIGVGNYSEAAKKDLYEIDTQGNFATIWIHSEEMSDKFSWFPVAESDVILLAVTYGWVIYSILVVYIFYFIHRFIRNYQGKTRAQVKGFSIFIFLIFSGIFQDWLNVQAYYVFLGISISLISSGDKYQSKPVNYS